MFLSSPPLQAADRERAPNYFLGSPGRPAPGSASRRAASAMRRWLFASEAGRSSSTLERRVSSTSPDRGRSLRSSSSHRRRLPGWGSPELGRPPQPQEQHKLRRSSDPELGRPQRPQEQHTGQLWDGRSIERRLNEQGVLSVLVRSARGLHAPDVDKGRADQYVRVSLGPSRSKSSRSKRTGVVEKTINPRYDCELQFAGALLDLTNEGLQLQLLDQDVFARGNDAVPSGVVLIEAAAFQQLLTSQTPAAEPTWVECSKRLDTQGYLSFSLKWEADPVKFVDVVEAAVALGVAQAKQLPHGGVCMSEEEWKARTEAEDAVAFGTHAPGSDAAAAASHLRGVTIGWLLEFTELHQCWEWTTQEVVDRIIKPATAPTRCRFADLKTADHAAADLKAVRTKTPRAPTTVGPAAVYVSHCWGGSWGALCRALSDEHDQAVRVWIDVVAVRLWQGNSADQGLHGGIISRCTSFVVVCSAVEVLRFNGVDCIGGLTSTQMVARRVDQLEPEFRTSLALLRSWVLAELLTALDTSGLRGGVTVKIGRLAKRPQGGYAYVQVEGMARALATLVDVEHAQARLPADEEMLRREVFRARAGGTKATNYLLQRLLSATASGEGPATDGRGELTRRGYAEEAREGATPTEQLTVWAVSAVGGGSFGVDSEELLRLISRGAQPAAFACDGISPLMAAVELQNVDAIELILFHLGSQASAAVNLVSPLDGQTALITASSLGNEGIVLILLQNRADPLLPNSQETFPLQVAAQLGKPSVVALLLKCRAKVDQRANPRKLTALHAAASANNTAAVQLLLKARAKVDERVQPRKITALHVAAGEGHIETVQLLLNVWKQNPGKAVQQLARLSSHDSYYYIINDRTKDGATALSLARSACHVHTVQFLLAANADPNTEVVTSAQSLEQHINSARGMSARSHFTDEDGMSARSGVSTARNLASARGITARSELDEEGGLSVRGGLSSRRDVGSARRISARSQQRTEEEGVSAQNGMPAPVRSSSRRANAIAISSMSLLAEQLDGYLASKDYELAAALLDPSVEWETPAWKASGHAAVRAKWASGVDDKWGVTPVWREVIGGGRGLVFTRECEAFRVMGWPVRLRQTFHVRQKGVGYVVLKTVIERL